MTLPTGCTSPPRLADGSFRWVRVGDWSSYNTPVARRDLALPQVSRNSSGYLTPRRKTRFRKFPWKSDPLRETVQTVPPRLTPRDPSEPTDAPENERKFAISGAKKSQSLKNRALCAAKKIPNPTHIGIEPPTTSKSEDLAKMTYSIPDFLSRGRKKSTAFLEISRLFEGNAKRTSA